MAPRQRALLRLYPGVTIPEECSLTGVIDDQRTGRMWAALEGPGMPNCYPGCTPVEFETVEALLAEMSRP